jgi:hypothetical protein
MPPITWTLHPTNDNNDEPPFYAILPNDGTHGLLIGELADVRAITDRLIAFLDTNEHDGQISHLDHQLGYRWLTVSEAAEQYDIPRSTITLACRKSQIDGAKKRDKKTWIVPEVTFRHWLMRRDRPPRTAWKHKDPIII